MKVETLEKSSGEVKVLKKEMKDFIKRLNGFVKEFYPGEFLRFKNNKNEAKREVKEIENEVLGMLDDDHIRKKLGDKDIGRLTNEKKVCFFYLENESLGNGRIKNKRQLYVFLLNEIDPKRVEPLFEENENGETAISVLNSLFPAKPKNRGVGGFAGANRKN